MLIFIDICFADAVKFFQLEKFKFFFQVTSKIQAVSSKLLPRSGIFLQATSKIKHFLPSYFQDSHISCKVLQDQTFFQDLPSYLQE